MPSRPIRQIIQDQKPVVASSSSSVSEACALMKGRKIGAIAVVDGGRLRGIFTERDAVYRVIAENRDPQATKLADVMTPAPLTIGPDRPFRHALHMMFEGGFRHVPVVDDGRLLGMVSARDALSSDLAEFESDVEDREHIAEILG